MGDDDVRNWMLFAAEAETNSDEIHNLRINYCESMQSQRAVGKLIRFYLGISYATFMLFSAR